MYIGFSHSDSKIYMIAYPQLVVEYIKFILVVSTAGAVDEKETIRAYHYRRLQFKLMVIRI